MIFKILLVLALAVLLFWAIAEIVHILFGDHTP